MLTRGGSAPVKTSAANNLPGKCSITNTGAKFGETTYFRYRQCTGNLRRLKLGISKRKSQETTKDKDLEIEGSRS